MLLQEVEHLLTSIKGVTFASLDALCQPKPGVDMRVVGEQVLLYQNKNVTGYQQQVKRALERVGRDPDKFVFGDLPWGERVEGTPIIVHKDRYYLQCIVTRQGEVTYFISNTDKRVNPEDVRIFPKSPPEHGVYVHTYRLDNIVRLSLLGETVGERLEGKLHLNV